MLQRVNTLLPAVVTSRLPAARAAFEQRWRRVWGAVEVGACERTIKSERAKMMKKLQLTRLVDVVRAAEMVGLKLSFDDGPTAERQP